MTLEKSKEELKQLKEDLHGNGFVYGDFDKVVAIDTILNYIENESIPKEKVREKIKDLQENNNGDDYNLTNVVNILKELLGE